MKKKTLLASIIICTIIFGLFVGWAGKGFASMAIPPAQSTSGMPPVVVVSGSNFEMGYQYADQVANLIYHNVALLKSRLIQKCGKETMEKDMKVWAYYMEKHDSGLKDWLRGIQVGCRQKGYNISYIDLVAITVYPAQMWARPDIPYPPETGVGSTAQALKQSSDTERQYHACTSFAASAEATRDGKPIVAITKMVPIEVMHNLILIAFPDNGPSFIANPYAGAVVQNSGMNRSGFAWVLTAIFGPPAWGVVTEIYFHYLTQYCDSPAEARKFLESTPRAGVTGNFVMSDGDGNISLFESNAKASAVRKPGDAGETATFLVNTNHHIHPSMQPYNIPWEQWKWNLDSLYRYATCWEYVSAGAGKGEIDFPFAKRVFQSDDWYDPDSKVWHYNDPGSQNVINNFPSSVAQSIFFPADLIAYFQVGTPSGIGLPGGATGEFVRLQLADNPAEVTKHAQDSAFALYSEARNLFAKELNAKAPYLTYPVAQSIEEMLDEAMSEFERGMDRAGFAYMSGQEGTLVNEQVVLWSQALTHYAKTQLLAQMVFTRMQKLAASAQ